jgi:CheY-like chemotaxis protein/two-component sensor histidine kinase
MRDYMRRLLGERWDVELAATGSAALAAVRRERPDLVITDVMMPGLDGFGLLAELRNDERTRHLPVILLSARAGDEARAEGLQAGATDYLVKPFSSRELLALVDSKLLSERVRAVEEAQARRLGRIFAQAPVGFALLRGPEHVFEMANPSYLELIGARPVLGRPLREALPEVGPQGVLELLDEVWRSGKPHVGRSFRLLVERGQPQPEECFFDFVYQPIEDDDGAVESIAVVVFEVTALVLARRDAEVANRTKDEFLAMLGHELRNPLAPILTDDLLDVSRITQGKIQLRKQRIAVADAVARAVEMASPLLDRQRHTVRVDVPRDLFVDADPPRLAQVFNNLVTNAAKYTPPGGRITLTAAARGDEVVVEVADTGIGIDGERLARVFEPFAQARQAMDRSQGGLGLGLAIVSSLVRLHGGSVTASSRGRGLGSEFTVRLPRRDAGEALPSRAAPTPAPAATPRARVLVVDDNVDAAEMLTMVLEAWGYEARAVVDGPSALELAERYRPDLAILDLGLPVMDGFELARRFAGQASLREVRLIALTGYGQDHDRRRSAEAGFVAHLVKPVALDSLRELIAAQLAG